jgi:hypothetical protein
VKYAGKRGPLQRRASLVKTIEEVRV